MASAGDGGIGEEAAAAEATTTPTRNRRTIYDYLGEGEDAEEASPPSPETRLPRFTCATIRFGRKRGGKGGRRKEAAAAAAKKSEDASVDSSAAGWKQGEAAAGSSTSTTSGGSGSVATAGHTGVGLTMLFLLARTCVELNRMAVVRAQMEALLKEVRDEAASRVKQGQGGAADDLVLVAPKACCNNLQSSNSSSSTTTAAATAAASSSSCVSDDTSTTATNCLEIQRREDDHRTSDSQAELGTEAAAERRRRQPPECKSNTEQDTQCSSSDDDDGEFIELEGGRFGTGSGGSSRRGAVVDGGDEGGVSATELERRLHELQHWRDRERIEALESALRRARRKLTEKEMEARLWQDTATLALTHPVPQPRDGHGQ